jgi:hypothetical protein
MYGNRIARWVVAMLLVPSFAWGQRNCTNGMRVEGTITDPTGVVIPGAQVQASSGQKTTTDAAGHYLLPCLPATSSTITVEAEGFAQGTAQARFRAGEVALASVQADVQVSGDTAADPNRGPGTTDLSRNEVQQLADDPDDFLRQLQVLAANGGGAVQSVILTVDGFRNASVLPPKSSIASIRVQIQPMPIPDFHFESGLDENDD